METGRVFERVGDEPGETAVLNLGCSYRSLEKRTSSRTVDGGLCQDGCGWGGNDWLSSWGVWWMTVPFMHRLGGGGRQADTVTLGWLSWRCLGTEHVLLDHGPAQDLDPCAYGRTVKAMPVSL